MYTHTHVYKIKLILKFTWTIKESRYPKEFWKGRTKWEVSYDVIPRLTISLQNHNCVTEQC